MTQPIWKKLIALVELDQRIASVEKEIETINKESVDTQNKISSLDEKLERTKLELTEKRKKKSAIELKVHEIDELEKTKKKTLDQVKDQKAYKAIQKELSVLSLEQTDQEELLVGIWNDVEVLEKKVLQEEKTTEEDHKKFQDKIAELQAKKESTLEKLKEIQEKHQTQSGDVPQEWLKRYQQMKSRAKNPIVPILNSSCSACFYMILPQDLERIKNGELLHCRNCYRLLYYTTEEEPVF